MTLKKKFYTIDFSLYKSIFHNKTATIFSIICGIIFNIFIIVYFIKVFFCPECINDYNCYSNVILIIIYSIIFFGFFIYFIVIYVKVYNNNESFEIAKSIKAEKFIENFLKEFYETFEKKLLYYAQ